MKVEKGLVKVLIFFSLIFLSCVNEIPQESKSKKLVLTSQAFELEGEDTVDNFKLHWNKVSDAAYYSIYSSENSSGNWEALSFKVRGKTSTKTFSTIFDIYDLETETKYFKVKAFDINGNFLSESNSVKCVPTIDTCVEEFDNTTQSLLNIPSSIYFNGKYWRYDYINEGGVVSFEELYSDNGYINPEDINEGWISNGIVISGNPESEYYNPAFALSATTDDDGNPNGCKLESTSYIVTKDYVVFWSHYERLKDYTYSQIYCFYGTPGKFNFKGDKAGYKPLGNPSRDLISFVDDDGTGYLIGSTGEQRLYRLTDDYLKIDSTFQSVVLSNNHREAPCLRKHDGWYYLFTSESQGWYPSQGAYQSSKTIKGLAKSKLIPIGNRATFGAQSGQVQKIGNNYCMMANRWSQGWNTSLDTSSGKEFENFLGTSGIRFAQRMLPITMKEGYAYYDYYHKIKYDWNSGTVIPVQNGKLLSLNAAWTDCTQSSSGKDVKYALDGISFADSASPSWSSSSDYYQSENNQLYTFGVILPEPASIKEVDLTFRVVGGSDAYNQFKIYGSTTGKSSDWELICDKSKNQFPGFVECIIGGTEKKYRYVKLEILNVWDMIHNQSANWEVGLYEFSIYGE